MVKCCAYGCNSVSYDKTPGITFHRFPKNENIRKAWIESMNIPNWQPRSASVLCSKHFEDHFIDPSAFRTTLRPGTIPTLFNELPSTLCKKRNALRLPQKSKGFLVTAAETSVSVLHELKNKKEPVVPIPMIAIKDEENVTPSRPSVPVSTRCKEVKTLRRILDLKNKKIKALLQQRRRLRKKMIQFSDIIKKLENKLSKDDILSNILGI